MAERSKALVLGTSLRAWVRIPPSAIFFCSAFVKSQESNKARGCYWIQDMKLTVTVKIFLSIMPTNSTYFFPSVSSPIKKPNQKADRRSIRSHITGYTSGRPPKIIFSVHGGTRTRNLLLRRETPYPLGHADTIKPRNGLKEMTSTTNSTHHYTTPALSASAHIV